LALFHDKKRIYAETQAQNGHVEAIFSILSHNGT